MHHHHCGARSFQWISGSAHGLALMRAVDV
jgi:hypothetical protein